MTRLLLIVSFTLNLTWLSTSANATVSVIQEQAASVTRAGAVIGGFFGSYFVHESAHALMTLMVGGEVKSFTPYPHMAQKTLIPMGMEMSGRYKWQQFFMAVIGSTSSMAMAYFGAPLLKNISDPHLRSFSHGMAYTGALEWPFYSVWDGMTNFKGDWVWASKVTGLPRIVWIIPAFVASYFTMRRVIHYSQLEPGDDDSGVKYFSFGVTLGRIRF